LEDLTTKMGYSINLTPKRHFLACGNMPYNI